MPEKKTVVPFLKVEEYTNVAMLASILKLIHKVTSTTLKGLPPLI